MFLSGVEDLSGLLCCVIIIAGPFDALRLLRELKIVT